MGERDDRDIGRVAAASVPSPIVRCFLKMFIWIGEGLLLGIVECAANWLYRELDRRFPDLIDVVEERDNVDGEGSENENGSNVAAEVMDNENGEGNGNELNDNGVGETGEIRENTSNDESNGEGEVRDNNGDGSRPTVVHPIGGLIPFV
ncbi:hypothetical protein ACLB2K_011852 [Fragaria x ananassa]|uniref:putative uncharacterized protein DDB_G0287265 n=1 Tax=Fragaria vesca subsp. vesca TaxID=101020 RepID=UPI0005C968B1|nr:PREDICTED: putative uncharacterized protein DDB_G0287265 [Fragaria vesca subsp. vesca]XP_011457756.1 PREDICTED: putative uncharacterized protein DDB_G0287265 [Fragaria vesca subsp. vesca]